MMPTTPTTVSGSVRSHLSELQLSEHISYPNMSVFRTRQLSEHISYPNAYLAKPHPLFSATFIDAKLFK